MTHMRTTTNIHSAISEMVLPKLPEIYLNSY